LFVLGAAERIIKKLIFVNWVTALLELHLSAAQDAVVQIP